MSFADELIDLMNDEVTLEHRTGVDKFNNFSFAAPAAARCYIVRMNKRALDRGGRELVSTVQIFFANPSMDLSADDRLTLPDGTKPAIIEVLGGKDELGDPFWLEARA